MSLTRIKIILLSLSTNKQNSQSALNAQLISLMLPSHNPVFLQQTEQTSGDNEDYTRGALAVTAGKGLAKKLGNAQERRHLELKESSHFPENIPKLYLGNHKIKFLTD